MNYLFILNEQILKTNYVLTKSILVKRIFIKLYLKGKQNLLIKYFRFKNYRRWILLMGDLCKQKQETIR